MKERAPFFCLLAFWLKQGRFFRGEKEEKKPWIGVKVRREMEMMYYQLSRSSYQDSLKILEADIQHANAL